MLEVYDGDISLIVHHIMSSLAPLGKVEAEGWEEDGEEENTREVYTANRLSTYQTTDFPPKPVSIIGE